MNQQVDSRLKKPFNWEISINDGEKTQKYRFNKYKIEIQKKKKEANEETKQNKKQGTKEEINSLNKIRIGNESIVEKEIIVYPPQQDKVAPLHCQILIHEINDPDNNQMTLNFKVQHMSANDFETAIRLPAEPKDINKIEKGDKFILSREYYIGFNDIIDIAVNPEEIIRNLNNELIENSNLPHNKKEIMKVNCQDKSIDLTQFRQYCAIFITIQQRQKGKIDQTLNKYKCIFIEQDKEFVITRNFISDTSRKISSQHAILQLTNERKLFIIDNSQNGTEKLLKVNEIYPLSYNESFYIGNQICVIRHAMLQYYQDQQFITMKMQELQIMITKNLQQSTLQQTTQTMSNDQSQNSVDSISQLKNNYNTKKDCLQQCYQFFQTTPFCRLKSIEGFNQFYEDLTQLENKTNELFTSLKVTQDLEETELQQ